MYGLFRSGSGYAHGEMFSVNVQIIAWHKFTELGPYSFRLENFPNYILHSIYAQYNLHCITCKKWSQASPTFLTHSIRDSETSIDFVQGPPGSRRERVKTVYLQELISSIHLAFVPET